MKKLSLVLLLLGLISLLLALSTQAATFQFTEEFTTEAYKDGANTTAIWDTASGGKVRLPLDVTLASSCATGNARVVHASGNYAYVGDTYNKTLYIVDVSNPSSPVLKGSYTAPGEIWDVYASGSYAYVGSGSKLLIINVSNPLSPTLTGSYEAGDTVFGVCVSGGYAYLGANYQGLLVIDVSNPASPSLKGSKGGIASVRKVCVSGNYVYGANISYPNLQIFDVSNPASPSLVASCGLPNPPHRVRVSGNYVYVATYYQGLQIVNVSTPSSPFIVGSCKGGLPGTATGVAISGNYAYLCGDSGLRIFDVSNPSSPGLVRSWDYAEDVYASGGYAYLAAYSGGLKILNVDGYLTAKVARSTTVDITERNIVSTTLTATQSLPAGTQIVYEMSANGGASWESCTSGIQHDFAYPGADLRWRAQLFTTDPSRTPEIDKIVISYLTLAPQVPTLEGLSAISTSELSAQIRDNSNDEDDFHFYLNTFSPATTEVAILTSASKEGIGGAQFQSLTGLSLNTRYYLRVTAHNHTNNEYSDYSNELNRYTLAATPESLATVEVGGTYIKLSWSAGGNPAGTRYAVERAPDVGGAPGTWTYVATWGNNITAATYTDTGLNPNTVYWHRVRAYNGEQILTGPGNTVSAKTPVLLPILTTSDPTGITNSEATLQGSITYTGGENCSERGFEWGKFSGDYPSSWTEAGSFSTDPFTRTISVNPQTRYFFRAKARNSAGWGYGPEKLFTTPPYESATQTRYYRSDTHTVNGLETYKLQTISTEAGTYFQGESWYYYPFTVYYCSDVYIRHSDGSETALGTEVAQTYRNADGEGYQSAAWSCPQTALSPSDAIRITEKIGNPYDGWGWWSERQFITEPLGSPMLLSGTWTFTRDTYRSTNYYPYDPEHPEYGGDYQTVGRTYHGSSAYNTRIEGFSYQAPAPPPSAPSGATLEAITTSSMRFKWMDNSDNEQGFRIERATSETWSPRVIATVEANVISYEASGLSPNTRYFFRVCAYNTVGPSDYSTAGARYTLAATPEALTVSGHYDITNGYHCDITVNPGGNPYGTYYAVFSSEEAKWLKADGTTTTEAFWQTTTSWFHKNLSPNTTYSYKVKAKNGENVETSLSAAGSGTTPPPAYKTKVGSAESWEWRNATPGDLVPSGMIDNWSWRTWESGSGRKVPSGEARDWIWGNE